jgi:hypothetical protein
MHIEQHAVQQGLDIAWAQQEFGCLAEEYTLIYKKHMRYNRQTE